MVAFMDARKCGHASSSSDRMTISHFKQYFIAIDKVHWNYAPKGQNVFDGGSLLRTNR